MNAVGRALWNPIVAKEFRSRMRTWRSSLALMVYILLLAGLGWAIFASMASSSNQFGAPPANYGQSLFLPLVIFQMVLIAFITPALTAGAVSGESERQTIDLLFVTLLPPFAVVWGKLLASLSFILLLLVLSIPIFSLVFLFGGIEPDQLVYAFVVMAVTALMLGTIGIAFSTWIRRSLPATVSAYAASFVLLVGTLGYGLLLPTEINPTATALPSPPAITYFGPFVPLATIATNAPIPGYGIRYPNGGGGTGIYAGGGGCFSTNNGPVVCQGRPVQTLLAGRPGASGGSSGTTLRGGPFSGWHYWQASVAMQLAVCVLTLAVSAVRVQPVRRRGWWSPRLEMSPEA